VGPHLRGSMSVAFEPDDLEHLLAKASELPVDRLSAA
jgi:hypothetical protein